MQGDRRIIGGLKTTNAGSEHDTGAVLRLFIHILGRPSRIRERFVRGCDGVENEIVNTLGIPSAHHSVRVKGIISVRKFAFSRDLRRDLAGDV